jgi:hypothetical protein
MDNDRILSSTLKEKPPHPRRTSSSSEGRFSKSAIQSIVGPTNDSLQLRVSSDSSRMSRRSIRTELEGGEYFKAETPDR